MNVLKKTLQRPKIQKRTKKNPSTVEDVLLPHFHSQAILTSRLDRIMLGVSWNQPIDEVCFEDIQDIVFQNPVKSLSRSFFELSSPPIDVPKKGNGSHHFKVELPKRFGGYFSTEHGFSMIFRRAIGAISTGMNQKRPENRRSVVVFKRWRVALGVWRPTNEHNGN